MSSEDTGQQPDEQTLASVAAAFEACLDPRTANDLRREALQYIEQLTSKPEAPRYGIVLARDSTRPQAIRYFGLQMLEYALRYRFDTFDTATIQHMLGWVTDLAFECTDQEPAFFRNKVAQLWVECAERAWPDYWMNMDASLGKLWNQSSGTSQFAGIMLVLDILEALSADICGEENLTALRIDDLGSALSEIVVSEQFQEAHTKGRPKQTPSDFRWGHEGWLARLAISIADCSKQLQSDPHGNIAEHLRNCLLRALAAVRSLASWVYPSALLQADVLAALTVVLSLSDAEVLCNAVTTLYAINSKAKSSSEAPTVLRYLLDAEQVAKLATPFSDRVAGLAKQDEISQLQKKTSELLSDLLESAMAHADAAMSTSGYEDFLQLLLHVLQNNNLIVSIPVLHGWSKLLASRDPRLQHQASDALGALMETCVQRLVNFELLGEDFDHPIVSSLFEDFDTMPERHAFLANYRRYCVAVIEQVARRRPVEALEYVIGQTRSLLSSGPYMRSTGLTAQSYSTKTLAVQRAEAQFTANHSVIAGVFKWNASRRASQNQASIARSESQWVQVQDLLRQFCQDLLSVSLDDPEVGSGVIAMLSSIVRSKHGAADLVLNVTEYILNTHIVADGGNVHLKDCIRNFESLRVVELQKIALAHAETLLPLYNDLERSISSLITQQVGNTKVSCGYHAFLFIITLRAASLSDEQRSSRLEHLLQPLSSAWADPNTAHAFSTFDNFQEALGLAGLPDFYQAHGFAQVEDWAAQQLDDQGQERLALIKDRLEKLPLRMTRALLGATTEKLDVGTDLHDLACQLWTTLIPLVLPSLLQMIGHAQLFTNPAQWAALSPELQDVVRRTLQDRFWQSGISSESRDDFYARVSGSKTSYEGFASAVRGSIRSIRDQGYQILFLFTKFEEQFYGITDLPEPLANALFEDADSLSTNHLVSLISLVNGLTLGCPPHHRARFLPPLFRRMFIKLDKKIASEWEATVRLNEGSGNDDDLSEEMRAESVLRQVTYTAVSFIALLLEPYKAADPSSRRSRPTLTDLVLTDITVLEPVMLFCTHALRMRDTRCCTTVCKILTSILPRFIDDTELSSQVREFFCTEVLKAGITSINEQYFADMQRELAALLAEILVLYSPKIDTPRNVLLSLPDMQASKVDSTLATLLKARSTRQQRALVLSLLESVRGVSIHDMGKVVRSTAKTGSKSQVQAQYMEVEQKPAIIAGDEVGLDSMADLFAGG